MEPENDTPPMTVYEFLAEEKENYKRGQDGVYFGLYYQCARFVSLFTIADLRHDFEMELDIDIKGYTVGQWLCVYICRAYYDAGPTYNALLEEIQTIYNNNLTSDTTAKNFIKRELNVFYDTVITPYRDQIWGPDYYATRYDDMGSEPLLYDGYHVGITHNKITSGNASATVVLVDAQMGNPLDAVFKGRPVQSSVIYNYACALDAASKPITTMPGYLTPYIQKTLDPTPYRIPMTYMGFGVPIDVRFDYNNNDKVWETMILANVDERTTIKTFSYTQKASVNELGLIAIRGKMTTDNILADIKKLGKISLGETIAKHIFKSLGDRLQTFSMIKEELKKTPYEQNENLVSNTIWQQPSPKLIIDGKHYIQFTNDILASINNYLMQVNTVFTGVYKLIYYEYRPFIQIDEAYVRAFFTNDKQINIILTDIIKIDSDRRINIYNINTLINTIYSACAARDAIFIYCKTHALFNKFVNADGRFIKPTIATVNSVINENNYRSFVPLMTSNIYQTLLERNLPKEITEDEVRSQYEEIISNMSALDLDLHYSAGTLQGETLMSKFVQYKMQVDSLKIIFQNMGITNNTFLLANICLHSLGYKYINTYFFTGPRLLDQFLKLFNQDDSVDHRTEINKRLNESSVNQSRLNDDFQTTFRNELYKYLVNKVNSTIINTLEAAIATEEHIMVHSRKYVSKRRKAQTEIATNASAAVDANQVILRSTTSTAAQKSAAEVYHRNAEAAANAALNELDAYNKLDSILDKTMPYFSMAIAIKLIESKPADILTKIMNADNIITYSEEPVRISKTRIKTLQRSSKKSNKQRETERKQKAAKRLAPVVSGKFSKQALPNSQNKKRKDMLQIMEVANIGNNATFPSTKMSAVAKAIASGIIGDVVFRSQGGILAKVPFKRGGSRSKSKSKSKSKSTSRSRDISIIALCIKKFELIAGVINERDNRYYKNTVLYLINILSVILDDYYALKKSRSAPRVLHTSVLSAQSRQQSQRLSAIAEENEDISQIGGGGITQTIMVTGMQEQPSEQYRGYTVIPPKFKHTQQQKPSALVSGPPRKLGGEDIPEGHVIERYLNNKGQLRRRIVPASAAAPSVQPSPGAAQAQPVEIPVIRVESQKSASKVKSKAASPLIILSRKEGMSYIKKQLYAFFWLGVDRGQKQLEIENTYFADLLPVNDIFSLGNALNQIFWQPFFNYCEQPYETIYGIYTSKFLPILSDRQTDFRLTVSAPPAPKRPSVRQTRKRKASSA